jgi:hypothetical protein
MLDNSVLDGVSELEHSSFAGIDIFTHIYLILIIGAGNYNVILWPSYAE